jgi:hypothetical protein
MKTKTCTACNRDLPLDMFNKDNSRSDGLRSRCRECRTNLERKPKSAPKKVKPKDPVLVQKIVTVKDRETAYRQALVDLQYRYPKEFKELLQVRLREALLPPNASLRR